MSEPDPPRSPRVLPDRPVVPSERRWRLRLLRSAAAGPRASEGTTEVTTLYAWGRVICSWPELEKLDPAYGPVGLVRGDVVNLSPDARALMRTVNDAGLKSEPPPDVPLRLVFNRLIVLGRWRRRWLRLTGKWRNDR